MPTMQEAIRRLRIEATSTGVTEATRGLKQLDQAQKGVVVSAQGQERATVSMEKRLDRIRRQYDLNYRAQQTLARVERDLTRARQQGLITLQQQSALMDKATASVNRYAAASGRTRVAGLAGVQNFAAGFGVIGGAAGAALATRAVIEYGDAWTRTQNQLKVAGLEGENLDTTMGRLFQSAQRNAAPLEALVTLYGRATLVQTELNASSKEMLLFTDRVAEGLRISGRSVEESSGALLQLSQALGSGIVRAEEFNSILEGALPIAQAAARGIDGAGGSVARLRQMIVDGEVTSREFFMGFLKGSDGFREQINDMESTTSQGLTKIGNSATRLVGKLTEVTGVAEGTGSALDSIAEGMDAVSEKVAALEPFIKQMERLGALPSSAFQALAYLRDPLGSAVQGMTRKGLSNAFGGGGDAGLTFSGYEGQGSGLSGSASGEFDLGAAVKKSQKAAAQSWRRYDRTTDAITRQIEAMRIEAETFGMTEAAAARYRTEQSLLNEARAAGIALSPAEREGISRLADQYAEQVVALEAMERQFQSLEDVARSVTDGMGRAFDEFIEMGSVNFSSFVDGLLADLARIAFAQAIGDPLTEGLSSFLTGLVTPAGATASLFHEGGVVGSGGRSRRVHPAYFDDAPRYHGGGIAGLRPNEVPAILERGERVLPRGDQGGAPRITIVNETSARIDKADARPTPGGQPGRDWTIQLGEITAKEIRRSGSAPNMAVRGLGGRTPLVER